MNTSRHAFIRACLVVFLLSLSACSNKPVMVKNNGSAGSLSKTQNPCPLPSADIDDPDRYAIAEPEESAQEEIAALDQPGAWEIGEPDKKPLKGLKGSKGLNDLPPQPILNRSAYDFPVLINKQVQFYLDLFQGKQRESFRRWLARSGQYVPFIEKELRKAGLPRDLVYLAMIESGFSPSAYSCAGAGGLWQFIPSTGRMYNLKIDSWVDERREPQKATKAAVRYLSRLYKQFGDWHLAVAAYNTGENKIESAIASANTRNFWELAASGEIYLETKRYVPKLIAAILIARNPRLYGFNQINFERPSRYDVLDVPGGTDLEAIATVAQVPVNDLRSLNNELLKNQTPPDLEKYPLRLPPGTRKMVASNLSNLRSVKNLAYLTHTVKKGETLQSICSLYRIDTTTLLKANDIRVASLKKGQQLQIPQSSTTYVLAGAQEAQQNVSLLAAPQEPISASAKSIAPVLAIAQLKEGLRSADKETAATVAAPKEAVAAASDTPIEIESAKVASISALKKEPVSAVTPAKQVDDKLVALNSSAKTTVGPTASLKEKDKSVGKLEQKKAVVALIAPHKQAAPAKKEQLAISLRGKGKEVKQLAAKAAPVKTPAMYVVRNGDTMTTIAKKFQVSVNEIRRWNNLRSNNVNTGNKLVVKRG